MSSEWSKSYFLNDLCLKITDGSHQSPKSVLKGKPMASVKDMTSSGIDLSNARRISPKDFESLVAQGCQPQIGDVLIAKDGNSALDTVCCLNEPLDAVLLSSVAILRPNPELLYPLFLKYYLSSQDVISYLKSNFISGAAIPRVVLRDFKKARINLPGLASQRAIAKTLKTLDDRITLLRETNKTLEAIAQAIFKSWFVDFDPVRAKMEGRQPEGMDEATATLFPDSFEESELGLVPKGWSPGNLENLCILNPESWTAKNRPQKIHYVDLANTKSNIFSDVIELPFNAAPSRARRILRKGDTIIGTVRPGNKSYAYISADIENLTGSTGFAVLRPQAEISSEFIYLASTQDSSIEYLTHIADGGAYPAVKPEVISAIPCVLAEKDVLTAFHATIAPLFSSISNNQSLVETLTNIRDTLLPRLISGQLRLPEAQEQIENA